MLGRLKVLRPWKAAFTSSMSGEIADSGRPYTRSEASPQRCESNSSRYFSSSTHSTIGQAICGKPGTK
jgi:hypothetical protein